MGIVSGTPESVLLLSQACNNLGVWMRNAAAIPVKEGCRGHQEGGHYSHAHPCPLRGSRVDKNRTPALDSLSKTGFQ